MIALRSGSKGVKDKNIRPLGGIPLFAHAANAVLNSAAYRDRGTLMVNTDSEEYAAIANEYGAITPFIRPGAMAGDDSPICEAIDYTFRYFEERGQAFDLFASIQATSPFTISDDIDRAVSVFRNEPQIQSVISVTEADVPPVWCNTLDDSLSMKDFLPRDIRRKNRQDLPRYYRITGAVRIARWTDFQANRYDWYFDDSRALIVDRERSLDIDSEDDFLYAEFLMHRRKAGLHNSGVTHRAATAEAGETGGGLIDFSDRNP